MKLSTDFQDYYDELLTRFEDDRVYIRNLGDSDGKFAELKFLRGLGFETIDLKPVSKIINANKVVVYMNTKKHMGQGKQVLQYRDAYDMYFNTVCSEYFEGNEYTYKILQIGCKRYSLVIKNEGLVEKEIERLECLPDGLTNGIDYPIYSIDYINRNGKMVACDFNKVQKLSHIGFDKYIPASVIVNELNKYYGYKLN